MGLSAGQIALDTDLSALVSRTYQKPIGRLVQAVATSIPTGLVQTALTFTTEEVDTHGYHSTSVNTSRVTPLQAGYYRFTGTVFMAAFTTPVSMQALFRQNGSVNIPASSRSLPSTLANGLSFPTTAIIAMNGTTDYVELTALQSSAGAVNTNIATQNTSTLEWEFVRDL